MARVGWLVGWLVVVVVVVVVVVFFCFFLGGGESSPITCSPLLFQAKLQENRQK